MVWQQLPTGTQMVIWRVWRHGAEVKSEHGTGWFNSGGLRGVGTREEDTLASGSLCNILGDIR